MYSSSQLVESKECHNTNLQDLVQNTNKRTTYLRDLMWGLEKENDSLQVLLHKRSKENMRLRDYVWGLDKEGASLRALLQKKREENDSLWESDEDSASLFHLFQEKTKFVKSLEAFERRHPHSSSSKNRLRETKGSVL